MTKQGDYLGPLESAIKLQHKCRPTHKQTVSVREKTEDNETLWKGNVEVFSLSGHKNANICYAWHHTDGDGGVKIFAVLGNAMIDSPKRAVRAAIFMGEQPPVISTARDGQQILWKQNSLNQAVRQNKPVITHQT